MKLTCTLLAALVLTGSGLFTGTCELSRRERKRISSAFGNGVECRILPVGREGDADSAHYREGDKVYLLFKGEEVSGYLLATRTMGRFEYFDYSVLYSENLEVLDVAVTVYRSTHGAAVCRNRWLEQFTGYAGGELELGKQVSAISGATISATSLVRDMVRCHRLMASLIHDAQSSVSSR